VALGLVSTVFDEANCAKSQAAFRRSSGVISKSVQEPTSWYPDCMPSFQ
jgi:hypothetical protein